MEVFTESQQLLLELFEETIEASSARGWLWSSSMGTGLLIRIYSFFFWLCLIRLLPLASQQGITHY